MQDPLGLNILHRISSRSSSEKSNLLYLATNEEQVADRGTMLLSKNYSINGVTIACFAKSDTSS